MGNIFCFILSWLVVQRDKTIPPLVLIMVRKISKRQENFRVTPKAWTLEKNHVKPVENVKQHWLSGTMRAKLDDHFHLASTSVKSPSVIDQVAAYRSRLECQRMAESCRQIEASWPMSYSGKRSSRCPVITSKVSPATSSK